MLSDIARWLTRWDFIPARAWLRVAVWAENEKASLFDVRDIAARAAESRGLRKQGIADALKLTPTHVGKILDGTARKERLKPKAEVSDDDGGRSTVVRRSYSAVRVVVSRGRQWAARHRAAGAEGRAA
jgi:hypothetical protein